MHCIGLLVPPRFASGSTCVKRLAPEWWSPKQSEGGHAIASDSWFPLASLRAPPLSAAIKPVARSSVPIFASRSKPYDPARLWQRPSTHANTPTRSRRE